MNKTSQERGLLNRLREKVNITGKILETLDPEFAEMMDKIRSVDEKARENAVNVKDLVRSTKSYLNRRDYLAAATNMSAFHERCRYIAGMFENLIKTIDFKHYKFLLDQLDEEQKQQLFGYNPTAELNLVVDAKTKAALKKVAGVSDWWFKLTDPLADVAHNLTTSRGAAMKAFEKRFSVSFLKQLKTETTSMVDKTEKFLQFFLAVFKKLALAVAKRNVSEYMEGVKLFITKFAVYHSYFINYYQKNIVPLTEQARMIEEQKSKALEEAAAEERMKQQTVNLEEKENKKPETSLPTEEEKEKALSNLSKEDDENIPIDLSQKSASFISRIEKISSPNILVKEILKYSGEIENISPQKSLQLISIAEGIIEDYKSAAGLFDVFKKKPEEKIPEKKVQEKEKLPLV
jgi:hypothetical protein